MFTQQKSPALGVRVLFNFEYNPLFQSKQNWTRLLHKRKTVRMKFTLLFNIL